MVYTNMSFFLIGTLNLHPNFHKFQPCEVNIMFEVPVIIRGTHTSHFQVGIPGVKYTSYFIKEFFGRPHEKLSKGK
jgi:hypothetical protein